MTPGVLALLPADGLTLLFDTAGYHRIETRVFYDGRGTLRVGPARVTAERIGVDTLSGPFRDWPVAFSWVLGTVAAGWLLVIGMKRQRRKAVSDASRSAEPPEL